MSDIANDFILSSLDGPILANPTSGSPVDVTFTLENMGTVFVIDVYPTQNPATEPVKLNYDSATGDVATDARGADCFVDIFTFESNDGLFRPEKLDTTGQNFYNLGWPQSTHQLVGFSALTAFLHGAPYLKPPDIASLGRILPPRLSQEEWEAAMEGAWYTTPTSPRLEFQRQWVPMPALGDTDRDADVDSADLLNLIGNWTGAASEPDELDKIFDEGDFDFDSDVDTNDLLILIEGWTGAEPLLPSGPSQLGAAPSAATVPEPSSTMALLFAGLFMVAVARHSVPR